MRGGRERPKRFAVERSPRLRAVVCAQLRQGWSPASIAGRLPVETAQVPDGDPSFGDVDRWRYYNSNNLWVDLQALADLQAADPGAPVLPLIVNRRPSTPETRPAPR